MENTRCLFANYMQGSCRNFRVQAAMRESVKNCGMRKKKIGGYELCFFFFHSAVFQRRASTDMWPVFRSIILDIILLGRRRSCESLNAQGFRDTAGTGCPKICITCPENAGFVLKFVTVLLNLRRRCILYAQWQTRESAGMEEKDWSRYV